MGILSLTNLNQRVKTSDRLFYNQFHYCIKVFLPHCGALNNKLEHDSIDYILDMREHLWNKSRNINFGGSWRSAKVHKVTDQIRSSVHSACDYFVSCGDNIKLNIVQDFIYVYTNQYTMREDLVNLGFTIDQITNIKLNRPIGTVRSNSEDSIIRCYFKQFEITPVEKDLIFKFIDDNIDFVYPSRGVEYFGERKDHYLRNYFFIDFDDEKLINILELMTPNLIRKVMPIVK
jgi:hypothetical protein